MPKDNLKGSKEAAQRITADPRNKRVKVLLPNMKLRLMTLAQYERYMASR